MKAFAILTGALFLPLFIFGCGGGGERIGPTGEPGKLAMEDLGQFLATLQADGKKPPARMSEFEPLEPMTPVAGNPLRSGEIVYVWGAGIASNSKSILAYEKKSDSNGGWVLFQDGTVKKLTAAEFNAAPKAKK